MHKLERCGTTLNGLCKAHLVLKQKQAKAEERQSESAGFKEELL